MPDQEKKASQNDMVDALKNVSKNKEQKKEDKPALDLADMFKIFTVGVFLLGTPFTLGVFAVGLVLFGGYKALKAMKGLNKDDIEKAGKSVEENSPDKSVDGKELTDQLTKDKDGKDLPIPETIKKLLEIAKGFITSKEGKDLMANPAFIQMIEKGFGKEALNSLQEMNKEANKEKIEEKVENKETDTPKDVEKDNETPKKDSDSVTEEPEVYDKPEEEMHTRDSILGDEYTPGGPEDDKKLETPTNFGIESNTKAFESEPPAPHKDINTVDDDVFEEYEKTQGETPVENMSPPTPGENADSMDNVEKVDIPDDPFEADFGQIASKQEVQASTKVLDINTPSMENEMEFPNINDFNK